MYRKGLNQEQIINYAKEQIEKSGYDQFSMRALAEKLNVKTASLYAHVESMDALLKDVGLLALQEQKAYQLESIAGKHRDEAVMALSEAYRKYAKEHKELYRFIMQMPTSDNEPLKNAASMITEPAMKVLEDYSLREERKMHWQRILRGLMHGFISQEENGYFSHYDADVEESYRIAIQCLIDGLHREEEEHA